MSDVTVTNEPPATNSQEARTTEGTLKDQSSTTTPSSSGQTTTDSTEGDSFLTGKKADDTTSADAGKKPEGESKPTAVAPEKYADFTLPEGYKFDDAQLAKATELFKGMNLPQEAAQKLVDYYAENSLQASRAPYETWANLQKEWNAEILSRFPGEKAQTLRTDINRAIDTVLPPTLARSFRAALDLTGAGTHPDLVEGLSLLLRPNYEGTPVRGGGPTKEGQTAPGRDARPSIAEAMYPHLVKDRQ